MLLRRLCDMLFDVLHLLCPPAIVHAECFSAAVAGYFVEAGLRDQQACAARDLFEAEFDQSGCLIRVIFFGVDGIKLPGERKDPFGLHFLHDGLPFEVLAARIGNLPTRDLTRYEWAIQFHTKPLAKLPVIRQRTPDARNWRLEFNALLNMVVQFTQPPSCILARRDTNRNPLVALSDTSCT